MTGPPPRPQHPAGPEVSVVIPCHNAAEVLPVQLASLAAQECDLRWEVVVVDDGSTDGTAAVAHRYARRLPDLTIVRQARRRGAARARNRGAAAAAGTSLLFVDADDACNPAYVQSLGMALRTHQLVCPLVDFDRLNDSVHASPRPRPRRPHRMFGFLPHAGGGAIGIRRSAFEQIGGFDPALPWLHDADLCWRVQLALGTTLQVVDDAVSAVRLRTTLRALCRQGVANGRDGIRLRRRYAGHGVPWTPWSRHLRQWVRTLRTLAAAGSPAGRQEFAWRLGKQIGRLQGLLTRGA